MGYLSIPFDLVTKFSVDFPVVKFTCAAGQVCN